ncbi:MAG: T9SS type A sorting domain-containing protein [Ignavibacteriaceae bacterium]|nr:T9SS type A sorting domain-containing protein [Ignavibacteriaceae bacterium]
MKNNLPVRIVVLPLSIFFIAFVMNITLLAQGDNPLVDHVPAEWIENINYSDSEEDVITDAQGYDNFNLGVDFAEPHVTQNPNNPVQYFGAYNINGAWRTSDGHNWLHSTPPFGTSPNGDPCTAYDGAGNLYYETMYGGIQGCKVIRSTDNGSTWSASVTSIFGGDKNWLAADQTSGPFSGYVYTTMTRSSFNGHGFARSTNNGTSWTTTFNASNSPLPGAMVCVGPNGATDGGAVYFVTNSGSAFASSYTFYASTDGGATFTLKSAQSFAGYVGSNVNGRNSVQNMRTRPYPFIAADQSNGAFRGRLYCVYASNTPAGNGNKPDIFCRYSTNQGTTWSSPVVINDDASTTNHNQWHPSIWCDVTSGRLFVKWMDTRDTPTSDSAYIYASYSDDGGVTWAANQRISNQKMRINCTTCGGGGNPRYQGDYDAMVSVDNQALAMWTDFRSGSYGSYVGYFPDFAMLVSPTTIGITNNNDSAFVTVDVPSVKLYSSTAIFSATVSPTPPNGTLTLDFPLGNTLGSFPGSVTLRIRTSGNVTAGTYTITVQGEGPNGTPVHRRTVTLDVVVPVELTSFTANSNGNDVNLNWTTASEINNQGFEIHRKMQNGEFRGVGFIDGNGTTTEIQNYSFTDENLSPGNYSYRLKQVDFDGTSELSDVIDVEVSAPIDYSLSQNYPNPFNPSTRISYSIPTDGYVTLKVYDVLGNEVASLVDEQKQSGKFDVNFNASALSSGVYYYQIKAGEFTSTKKLVLMK